MFNSTYETYIKRDNVSEYYCSILKLKIKETKKNIPKRIEVDFMRSVCVFKIHQLEMIYK